jgi:transcriptional regulator with XRE-family HTH domain
MDLFTGKAASSYARSVSPEPEHGEGPWGAAIRYWLHKKHLSQADLVRDTKLGKNTISYATRGLDTTTSTLHLIAKALKEPLELVLVSPEWMDRQEHLERIIAAAVSRAMRERDTAQAAQPTKLTGELLDAELQREEEAERAANAERDKMRQKRSRPTRDVKKRIRRSS